MEEPERSAPARPNASRRVWLIAAGILLLAALVGIALGVSLGVRQGGPLLAPNGVGGRPTILIAPASVSPAASVAPSPSAVAGPTATVVSTAASTQYVVQPGDTLRSIAEEQYGDASQWPRIYDANRDLIGPNPDALVAGTTLTIPH